MAYCLVSFAQCVLHNVCMSKKPATKTAAPVMKRHNVFMPQELLDGLDAAATEKGGTAAEHLRKAVAQYLKRLKLFA